MTAAARSTGRPPVALTIAGSDPSGGAGIQADLKTFSALGAYGTSVITALTAQNTAGVTGIQLIPAPFVAQQLETLVDDVRIDAVKIGMLGSREVADAVAGFLHGHPHDVVVLDPVMVATSGDRLLTDDAVEAIRRLLPLAGLVTPNVDEAAVLLNTEPATDVDGLLEQARAIIALGAQRVLVKGGHLDQPAAIDIFVGDGREEVLTAPRIDTTNTHGTGCTLSSAIAALRAGDTDWLSATRTAKQWLTDAIAAADQLTVGHGHGPVHHFHQWWPQPAG
ncbi:MAG: bifunctional hydroxymethylpyrimidine kinase/phosphomethylpyrimidine kinase [Nakamurella sp.]